MFKFLLFVLCMFVLVSSVDPVLEKCLQDKCPDQYSKCQKTSGCEDKMNKCLAKCGAKVDKTCWTLCIGLPGAAANLATCAANQKCITVQTLYELIREFLDAVVTN